MVANDLHRSDRIWIDLLWPPGRFSPVRVSLSSVSRSCPDLREIEVDSSHHLSADRQDRSKARRSMSDDYSSI